MLRRILCLAGSVLLFMNVALVSAQSGFSDLLPTHANYTAIMDLKSRGVISGYPDGTFKPDQVVNRVEALKIILNASKIAAPSTMGSLAFSDVDSAQWYFPYLYAAVQKKIVAGYPDGTFKPTQTVNLVENLKMLLNAQGIALEAVSVPVNPFADAFADQWYAKFVQYAKDKKLIEADGNNKIYPSQGMTRGKLSETVYRLLMVQEAGLDYFGQVKDVSVPPTTGGWDNVLQVSIKDMAFNKAELIVPVGGTVRWVNNDSMNHDVTSVMAGQFKSPTLSSGQTWDYVFTKEGTFDYYCSLHPAMKGKIIVKPAHQVPTI